MARKRSASRTRTARAPRRLVITVCLREAGTVRLALDRGGGERRLDAAGVAQALRDLIAARRIDERVSVREGCAGGCTRRGPNVDVTMYPATQPGAKPDPVASGWKTYVYSLASLDCLASIIDANLYAAE